MLIATLFTITKKLNQTKMSMDGWINEGNVDAILFSHKKELNSLISSKLGRPGGH
jgi:hypothetical protein